MDAMDLVIASNMSLNSGTLMVVKILTTLSTNLSSKEQFLREYSVLERNFNKCTVVVMFFPTMDLLIL